MFASEKVMREYLSQLLSEQEELPTEINESKLTENLVEKNTEKSERFAVNKKEEVFKQPVREEATLRPIQSKVNTLPRFEQPVEQLDVSVPNSVEKLLAQVEAKQAELAKEQATAKVEAKQNEKAEAKATAKTVVQQESAVQPAAVKAKAEPEVIPEEAFQALFFEVAGLVLAVPLYELGGIHNLTEVNSLFGKPDWYKGVMVNREKKLNVVDSAKWVMPERYNADMEESIDYQYLITLGTSDWGLAAERLVETQTIKIEDVKWRKGKGKRPWLYGTIKKKMCALLHVGDLIAMLEQGVNARQE